MSFMHVNAEYETWLRKQCDVVEADLERKHCRMRRNSFVFLRATYFRWARSIEGVCPGLIDAPAVLAVGDIHVENFGTWRDADGRLVWGVNDFDEAAVMPYTLDLLRLATSVRLTPNLALSSRRTCEAVLFGYEKGLDNRRPTLLDERATWMRSRIACSDSDRERFWRDIEDLRHGSPPALAQEALRFALPGNACIEHFAPRTKGGGSLGRPRYIVVAKWCGGRIVREAKAVVPSAWHWAHRQPGHPSNFLKLAQGRFRAPDPFLALYKDQFVARRLAADSRKIDLGAPEGADLDERLLTAMGADLAAIHGVRDEDTRDIKGDLEKRSADWLYKSAKEAAEWVGRDFDRYVADTAQFDAET
ncbi:DUF2252 family protein [Labrys monachus]|uniref:DUF2252 domain-containing protein n=1 Tax=Labrys monachus TaxID=217067 RepID=A0ABU0FEW2_9HYPH|nr:DUF2252 family protein [Labrys monachus]MDQ0392867.1 hypothetical protein [Labrys monachus]